jgi:hypothetical protein
MMRFSRLPRLVTATLGIFFALATLAPLPFAIVLPGEAQNIFKGVISFKGLTNYPPSGRIDLMSIRVTNPDAWIFGPNLCIHGSVATELFIQNLQSILLALQQKKKASKPKKTW